MKRLQKLTIVTLFSIFTTPAFSDVSVHVLDTNKGLPGQNIEVQFLKKMVISGSIYRLRLLMKKDVLTILN